MWALFQGKQPNQPKWVGCEIFKNEGISLGFFGVVNGQVYCFFRIWILDGRFSHLGLRTISFCVEFSRFFENFQNFSEKTQKFWNEKNEIGWNVQKWGFTPRFFRRAKRAGKNLASGIFRKKNTGQVPAESLPETAGARSATPSCSCRSGPKQVGWFA